MSIRGLALWTVLIPFVATSVPAHAEIEDVSSELKTILDEHDVPALAVAVIVDGEVVATGATGIRKRGDDTPVTVDDKWHLGSCTKAFTTTLAALLVRDGLIEWDSTVGEVFARERVQIHPDFRSATLRQLLSNTGGCPQDLTKKLWGELWQNRGTPRVQRMQLVRGLLKFAPEYTPGAGHVYSNAGFSVAGAMLETVANEPYETLVRQRIFEPLGMTAGGFRAPATKNRVDQPYGHAPDPVDPEPKGDNPRAIAPAGAIHCSITDWARFAQAHLGSDKSKLLTPEERTFLHTVVDEDENYALGWYRARRRWANGDALNHNGSNTMWYSTIWLAPERNFAVVVTSNCGGDVAFQACDAVVAWSIGRYLE
ncbi:MAG: beta-lactamase family protein [Planctomycetaceae bacterium]|nr:beta-lactamase family protein [Planctomycetaceae bacterium]